MITSNDVEKWRPYEVHQWLRGLCDNSYWINVDYIVNNELSGKHLLMITTRELYGIGATKVDLQEHILGAIEKLGSQSTDKPKDTLQMTILRLACQARSLQKQLVANRLRAQIEDERTKSIILTRDFQQTHHQVELDTLACVSDMMKTVTDILEVINRPPYSKYDDYRSMKSLILALSVELTSTAQRDQFVVRPNDIIEKSSKALADYCDRIVYGTKDVLLIQPIQIKTVRVRKGPHESSFGFKISSLEPNQPVHVIKSITPLSAAKKTNELAEGDQIIFLNQCIIGWSERNVQNLLDTSSESSEITLKVRKNPTDL